MEYSIIAVSGADRVGFLQGQLTQDIAQVTPENGLQAAWCTPKGRVWVTCRVFAAVDELLLVVPASSLDAVLAKLTLYRLRADVALEATDAYRLVAVPADRALARQDGVARLSLPFAADHVEIFATPGALQANGIDSGSTLPDDVWAKARCTAGLVDIDAANAEQYTPHMLNLDRSGAVSFSKGCYTGQEVVARTENLGRVKRRVNRYRVDGHTPAVGDVVTDGGEPAGHVVNAAADEALAVVPVDRHEAELASNGCRLLPAALPYTY